MTTNRTRRAILAMLGLVLVAALLLGWQVYPVYTGVYNMTGKQVPRSTLEPTMTPPPFGGDQRINFLVLGSDNDKKKEEAHPLSQSMIVVTVDPVHDKVGILSIPRDFWVPIRGHGMGKIDLAYKYGGVQLARETVERLFGIPIDYYAWVGLNGFIRVIDTFGGVTLDATHPILDDRYPNDLNSANPYGYERIFIPAGWQHMTGAQALEYVRSRHGDLIGDFGRSARQQQVLLQLHQKISAMALLTNLPQLIADLRNSVRTDLTPLELYELDQLSRRVGSGDVQQVVLQAPAYSSYGWLDGQSIVRPNWTRIRPLIRRLFAPLAPPSRLRSLPQPTPNGGKKNPGTTPVATSAPAATPAATATPTLTPTPTAMQHLSAPLLYVQGGNIFKLRPSGSSDQLTFTGDAAMPSLSPDGKRLAFMRFYNGASASDLWLLDLRNHREHAITQDINPLHVTQPDVSNNLWAAWPTWSPDGSRLVFSWDRAKLVDPPSDIRPGDLAIWSLPLNRGPPTQVTTPARGSGGDTEPTWRPGKQQFFYVKWNNLQPSGQPYSQLVLVDSTRGASWTLTPEGGRVLQPAWDPRGKRVAFIRLTNGVDEIAVAPMTQSSNGPRLGNRIVIARGEVTLPAFSPDGRWVSYLRAEGDGFSLYVARASGGPSYRIDSAGSKIDARSRPIWLP